VETLATERQTNYLRDLGIEPRTNVEALPKELASAWIEELKGYATRAGVSSGLPLKPEHLARLGARNDALAQPPARSLGGGGNGFGSAVAAQKPASNPEQPKPKVSKSSVGDESWIKVEFSAGVTAPEGESAEVTVSASTHLGHGPSDEDTEELGELVRRFLEREVARFHRAYLRLSPNEE
jgi:hypothetical protein